ncbi:MAG: site-2 protease family protein [Clostridiales bacterium]|nr:site-2 protease family protein [Clostridiales bacterium]
MRTAARPRAGRRFTLRATPGFWVVLALLVMTEEGYGLSLLFFVAAVCHELGHLLTARAMGLPVEGLTLSAVGAELRIRRGCSWTGELALALAGPGANLLLALGCSRLAGEMGQLFAGVNIVLACFNLLPVPPLDGGQAVRLLLGRLFHGRGGWRAARAVADLTCGGAVGAGLWLAWRGNPALLLLGLWLTMGRIRGE